MRLTAALLFSLQVIRLRLSTASSLESRPRPTSVARDYDSIDTGVSPRPTPGPVYRAVKDELLMLQQLHLDLVKRDNEHWLCGYKSAMSSSRITCNHAATCFYSTRPGGWGNLGCCPNSDQCIYRTACVERTESCNSACRSNSRVLKCTSSSAPYCGSISNPEYSVTGFLCQRFPTRSWIDMRFTYHGDLRPSSTNTRLPPGQRTLSTARLRPTSPMTAINDPDGGDGGSDGGGGRRGGKHTPIGAIIGGVIGGLALIAAVAVATIFLCLRRRRDRQQQQESQQMQQQQQPQSYAPPPALPQQYYQPDGKPPVMAAQPQYATMPSPVDPQLQQQQPYQQQQQEQPLPYTPMPPQQQPPYTYTQPQS